MAIITSPSTSAQRASRSGREDILVDAGERLRRGGGTVWPLIWTVRLSPFRGNG